MAPLEWWSIRCAERSKARSRSAWPLLVAAAWTSFVRDAETAMTAGSAAEAVLVRENLPCLLLHRQCAVYAPLP
jgi:hypothetical protein